MCNESSNNDNETACPTLIPFPQIVGVEGDSVEQSGQDVQVFKPRVRAELNASVVVQDVMEGSIVQFALVGFTEKRQVFAHSQHENGSLLSSDEFPKGVHLEPYGNFSGVPLLASDLTTYAITCVSFPQQVTPPNDLNALLLDNYSLLLTAWNQTGVLDETTGEIIGFTPGGSYPSSAPVPPRFCPKYWMSINVLGEQSEFIAPTIATAFHNVRNPGRDFAIYPDNPEFSQYRLEMLLQGIPFLALTGLCLMIWPSYVCLRCCCKCSWRLGRHKENADSIHDSPMHGENSSKFALEVIQHKSRMNKILTPKSLPHRLCFLFTGCFLLLCNVALAVGWASVSTTSQSLEKVEHALNTSRTLGLEMLQTADQARALLEQSMLPQEQQSLIQSLLSMEVDRISRFATMCDPLNLRLLEDGLTPFVTWVTFAIRFILVIFLLLIPVSILWSLVLASCTFFWGDRIACTGSSICLGRCLKCSMVLLATVSWACATFFFWSVAVASDICFLPSILHVPPVLDSLWDTNRELLEQPLPYSPAANTYALHMNQSDTLWSFFYGCEYRNIGLADWSVNPYSTLLVQAHAINEKLRLLVSQDSQLLASIDRIRANLTMAPELTACESMGNDIITAGTEYCTNLLLGDFLTMFFVCSEAIALMIVLPFTHWIMPNLYRQYIANKEFDSISKAREKNALSSKIQSSNELTAEDRAEEESTEQDRNVAIV